MAFRGLKTLTAVNIAAILFIAMGLVNLILVIFQQESAVRQEVARGRGLIHALASHFPEGIRTPDAIPFSDKKAALDNLVTRAGFPCALVLGREAALWWIGKKPSPEGVDLENAARNAMEDAKESLAPFGRTWGIFWKREQGYVLAMPLVRGDEVLGGISLVLPLEALYADLRNAQKLVWIYIVVNVVVFTGIGVVRVSRAYFRPVRRLARRAEDYAEADGVFFLVRKEDDEFGRLSQSLNSMLQRISEDREKLKSTIASLARANKELRQAQQEIIRTEKFASVGRLASGIAHEIGNPIGIVAGYLELLRRTDTEKKEKEEYIQRSIREVERIHAIIRQLLDFSRSKGENTVCFSIHDAIGDITRILEPQPLMTGIQVNLALSAKEDRVRGDPDQARQVFLNLVLNAADAIASIRDPASGTIAVSSENTVLDEKSTDPRTVIRILISDDGPGIPGEDMDAIFDPFYTTKAPGKGTGLGLWVSYMIVEQMGGRILVRSRPGEGTTMEVLFPVYRENGPQSQEADAGRMPPSHDPARAERGKRP